MTSIAMNSHIGSITLEAVLPVVFSAEPPSDSGVWLRRVCFERGHFYRIEAASGAGKSSLCSYIYGTRADYSGHLFIGDTDAAVIKPEQWQQLRRMHLAYVPQELGLFGSLTALENIELKNRLTGYAEHSQIERWLTQLGIAERADWPAARLSVGQRQRVALIRALCQPFDFLLLDEPVSHLDAANNHLVAEMVTAEARRQGAAIISTSVGNPLVLEDAEILSL